MIGLLLLLQGCYTGTPYCEPATTERDILNPSDEDLADALTLYTCCVQDASIGRGQVFGTWHLNILGVNALTNECHFRYSVYNELPLNGEDWTHYNCSAAAPLSIPDGFFDDTPLSFGDACKPTGGSDELAKSPWD